MPITMLVTGANRGIGLEIVRQAAARGDDVIATARRAGEAPDLQALSGGRAEVAVHGADVTDPVGLAAIAHEERRAVDLVVCNAGHFAARGDIEDAAYTPDTWRDELMTNVAGPFFTVRAFLPNLLKSGAPKVAVISSVMGSSTRARGDAYGYRASKAAACNIALNLAEDLRPRGIAVGCYHPGWVRTDMGGERADTAVEDSAAGLLARFDALSLATSGCFENHLGETIPF